MTSGRSDVSLRVELFDCSDLLLENEAKEGRRWEEGEDKSMK